jgi:hypothetical protein
MNEWLKTNMMVVIMAVGFIISASLWVGSLSSKSGVTDATLVATNGALTVVNARMDRLFDKLDSITGTLPVMAEQIKQVREAIALARGDAASLDVRLRGMENNIAAVHAEAIVPDSQKPRISR